MNLTKVFEPVFELPICTHIGPLTHGANTGERWTTVGESKVFTTATGLLFKFL